MNTAQFGYEKGLRQFFRLPHMEANYRFHTVSSITFDLGRKGLIPFCFHVFGVLDVHHQVDPKAKTKVHLRIFLLAKYQIKRKRERFVARVFDMLEIPPNTAYEASFITIGVGRFMHSKTRDPNILYD